MRFFEEKIVLDFKGTAKMAGMGKAAERTRPWVLGHLASQPDYSYRMFKQYREFCVENALPISTYPSFRLMIYHLDKEGRIKKGKREPGIHFQERQYWELAD